MMRHILKRIIIGGVLFLSVVSARAQFLDSTTGLLLMPTAVMDREGTFMITTNYLNQHTNSTFWGYNTFGYGLDVALWNRVEFAYVCTLMHGTSYFDTQPEVPVNWVNQDRHFSAKILLLYEGEFGQKWLPALAFGVSDPMSTAFNFQKRGTDKNNGYYNRFYLVASKQFDTPWGPVGTHAGYQYNLRDDYYINALCAGIDWKPVWMQTRWLTLDLVAEYDSRTFNFGFIASLWNDHIEAMFDLQALRWVSFGLRLKIHVKD